MKFPVFRHGKSLKSLTTENHSTDFEGDGLDRIARCSRSCWTGSRPAELDPLLPKSTFLFSWIFVAEVTFCRLFEGTRNECERSGFAVPLVCPRTRTRTCFPCPSEFILVAGRSLTVEGPAVETGFVWDFTKTAKRQNILTGTGVLISGGLGGVSGAAGVWLFGDLTVGSLFSAHSKPEVT